MAERSLRGTSIGSKSLETDENVEFASRHDVTYVCPVGHKTIVPIADGAQAPDRWECRCGRIAKRQNVDVAEKKGKQKPQRTPWDMLRERRTIPELQELLEHRLKMHEEGWFPDYE